MKLRTEMIGIALVASAVACGGGGDAKKESGTTDGKPAASAAGDLSDADIEKAEIPVESDFEDEAFEQINAENVDSEVEKLAKEIEGA